MNVNLDQLHVNVNRLVDRLRLLDREITQAREQLARAPRPALRLIRGGAQ